MRITLAELFGGGRGRRSEDGYSRALQAARVRAAYQRAYFAPALFNLVPVATDQISSMAVDVHWRLYYNEGWLAAHSVEENAAVMLHEIGHLLRDHEARRKAAGAVDERRWNTAGDCEINDDLLAEGLPLPGDPPLPGTYGMNAGSSAEIYYHQLPEAPRSRATRSTTTADETRLNDCGSGAHGERRAWELPPDDEQSGGVGGVDRVKAELVRREVAQHIQDAQRDRGRRAARLAALGARDADAEGGLHGDDPPRRCAGRFATAPSAATTARTGGLTGGRPATASSSCRASTSRARAPGSSSTPPARWRIRSWHGPSRSSEA